MQTQDGLIEVIKVGSISSAVFSPADWSLVNLPVTSAQATAMSRNMYNTAVSNHLTLLTCRHSRKHRPQAVSNVSVFSENWKYLDNITVLYEKPSSGSNNGLLPISEHAYLFYKGDIPNTKSTSWFQNDALHVNATNHWDVGLQPGEEDGAYYQKFSWELNLLMKSMCGHLEHRTFIHAVDTHAEELAGIYRFCSQYYLKCKLYITDDVEFRRMQEVIQKLGKR